MCVGSSGDACSSHDVLCVPPLRRGEDIPSECRGFELSAFGLLTFSLSGASHASARCVGFRSAFSSQLVTLGIHIPLHASGLTHIRHSAAQVIGVAIQCADTAMQSHAADDIVVLPVAFVEWTSPEGPSVKASLPESPPQLSLPPAYRQCSLRSVKAANTSQLSAPQPALAPRGVYVAEIFWVQLAILFLPVIPCVPLQGGNFFHYTLI